MREDDPVEIDWDPAALNEVDAQAEYYESERRGLSRGMFAELKTALAAIRIRPLSFPRLLDVPEGLVIRRALLKRFPFAVIFLELPPGPGVTSGDLPRAVRVVAFAHAKRRPGYWLWRIEDLGAP